MWCWPWLSSLESHAEVAPDFGTVVRPRTKLQRHVFSASPPGPPPRRDQASRTPEQEAAAAPVRRRARPRAARAILRRRVRSRVLRRVFWWPLTTETARSKKKEGPVGLALRSFQGEPSDRSRSCFYVFNHPLSFLSISSLAGHKRRWFVWGGPEDLRESICLCRAGRARRSQSIQVGSTPKPPNFAQARRFAPHPC